MSTKYLILIIAIVFIAGFLISGLLAKNIKVVDHDGVKTALNRYCTRISKNDQLSCWDGGGQWCAWNGFDIGPFSWGAWRCR